MAEGAKERSNQLSFLGRNNGFWAESISAGALAVDARMTARVMHRIRVVGVCFFWYFVYSAVCVLRNNNREGHHTVFLEVPSHQAVVGMLKKS